MSAFYNDFDRAFLADDDNRPRKGDDRSVFAQDRDRVLFSAPFRRLQSKTQVFQTGEYDFYRTRLTHSLEVASIARSIANSLRRGDVLRDGGPDYHLDTDLIEAICLSHDIGHPPFGHCGERVLHDLMQDYGGFEGNAQSARVLTRTAYTGEGGRHGLSPSRALLDGVLKYKRLYGDRGSDGSHYLYDDQRALLHFCCGDAETAARIPAGAAANGFRSIECQVMDFADDIAYSVLDVVDAINAGFIRLERLLRFREEADLQPLQAARLAKLAERVQRGALDASMSRVIGTLVQSARLVPAESLLAGRTNRYRYRLEVPEDSVLEIDLYKKLCRVFVLESPVIQQLEWKAARLVRQLFTALLDNYVGGAAHKARKLVPEDVHTALARAPDEPARARLLCDHISSLTDATALRTYKRLFDPEYTSISELL